MVRPLTLALISVACPVRPSTISIVVVLPALFGPSRATVSPGAMARSTERTARTPTVCLRLWQAPGSRSPSAQATGR